MSRDSFLARVRDAAIRGRAHSVETHVTSERPGCFTSSESPIDLFAQAASDVGGEVFLCDDEPALLERVNILIDQHQPKNVFRWEHELLSEFKIPELLAEREISQHSFETLKNQSFESQRESILAADLGITSCDWAIAETGSLVLCAKPGQERLASLAPPVHIAIIAESQILLDLYDLFDQYETAEKSLPSNLVINTGPSKTGDIEMKLTTGIHGPKLWQILILRGR
ncbi:MAG: LutC/YkgG family protein [Pirellulales bacterium]